MSSHGPLVAGSVAGLDARTNARRAAALRLVNEQVLPHEAVLAREPADAERGSLLQALQAQARTAGLWAPHLSRERGEPEHAAHELLCLQEVIALALHGPEVFGTRPSLAATEAMLARYRRGPLHEVMDGVVDGTCRICFGGVEPQVAGSTPAAIDTRLVADGDGFRLDGRKWFVSHAADADFLLVLARDERNALVIAGVPRDADGVQVEPMPAAFGRRGDGECTLAFSGTPVTAVIRDGAAAIAWRERFEILLGCMTAVGRMWRAFDVMTRRATERTVHDGLLEGKQLIRGFVADAAVDVQAARQLTLRTCALLAMLENRDADFSLIKLFVPAALHRVVDRAIQVLGALGVSGDAPLAGMYLDARVMRIKDGADELHRERIAAAVFDVYHAGGTWDFSA
jgi:acyl-CoA dehydrogenase